MDRCRLVSCDKVTEYMTTMLTRIIKFYVQGFREMTIGKTLWAVILIKLFIIFAILKAFFFPDVIKQKAEGHEAEYVAEKMLPVF